MNASRFALRTLTRDWKSGELTVLLLAVIVAVAALTAVGFFTNRVNQAVALQAAEVLAADLRLRASQPIGEAYFEEAGRRGLDSARIVSTVSVVFHTEHSQLTSLRMVSEGYPLRGRVRIADRPFAPARVTGEIPAPGEVWADSRLLSQLQAGIGARLDVGAATFTVTRVLDYRPDQGSQFVDFTPSLLMNLQDAPLTQLLQPGSRVRYIALFAGARGPVEDFRGWLEREKQEGERLRDISEASPQIRASTDRAGRFLNLSALASVLLAAIAVAMAARRYVQRHLDGVALMKCMGASQRFILTVNVYELVLLALVCAAVGTAIGFGAQAGLTWLLQDLIRGELPPPTFEAAGLGLVTATAVLIGFALPQLLQLRRVPPLRVLRRDMNPPPLGYSITYGLAVAAVLGMLLWLVRDVTLVLSVAAGIASTLALLYGAGWLLVRSLAPLRGAAGVAWRYGLANIARRGRESIIQIAAFGLGLMVLLLLAVVRNDLVGTWQTSLPPDMPNHFFINIPPHERAAFEDFFVQRGQPRPELFPMLRARLTQINGRPTARMKFPSDRGRNFADRDQNLSWSANMQADNRIVAGSWWTEEQYDEALVSVATEYRDEMNLKLGDRLTFDIAGETLEVRIASFRQIQWDRFTPNFFLVLPPELLTQAAGTYLTSQYLDDTQRQSLVELVRRFPAVSIFDVEALLAQVRDVMDQAARAVQYVFLFTLLAGVTVLLAAIQSTREERRYESAMLRTLGASRRTVLLGVAAEFIALGLLAGTLAALGASAAGYFVATRLFDLTYGLDPWVWTVGWALGVLLVGVSGVLATRSVVNHPPAATLRRV
jgi:putative ABC transport system permease protein